MTEVSQNSGTDEEQGNIKNVIQFVSQARFWSSLRSIEERSIRSKARSANQMSEALGQDANQPQPVPAPVPKNQLVRGFEKVSLWLAWIGIPVFLALLAYSVWLFGWTRGNLDAIAFAQSHAQFSMPAGVSSPDVQKAIDAAVDAAMKREELLLDKLLLVVGLYSTILSVLALATVFFSRQDAEKQLASTRRELETIQSKAKRDLEALKARLESEFPVISRLQDRLQRLILELEDRFPEDENLYSQRANSWPTELKQQNSLIDESKILAVSVVALDKESLLKLYLALARFYFYRLNTGPFTESDAARSDAYASRAIKDNPLSADAYRLRGATTLARYHHAQSKGPHEANEAQDLLPLARADCNRCIELDPCSAGALYNLSLTSLFEYRLKKDKPAEATLHLDKAIQVLESVLAVKERVPRNAKEKYLPDVYINLGCLFAYKSEMATIPALQNEMYNRIVRICTEGRDYLRTHVESSRAENNFKESLARELEPGKDFAGLPLATRVALKALLSAPWDNPVP